LQRAALLIANNKLYVAFGAHQDAPPFQGWLMAFHLDTLQRFDPIFCTTPGGEMGGIWQAGNGPAADKDGNVYLITGNGSFEPASQRFGNTLLKLTGDLKVSGWFAPANTATLSDLDVDFGSAGPLLLPDTDQVVAGGKRESYFWSAAPVRAASRSTIGGEAEAIRQFSRFVQRARGASAG